MIAARRRYRIDWYLGSIKPTNLVKTTKYKCQDTLQAREFAKLRRPRLVVVITPVPSK
jgi:hypothetical protein